MLDVIPRDCCIHMLACSWRRAPGAGGGGRGSEGGGGVGFERRMGQRYLQAHIRGLDVAMHNPARVCVAQCGKDVAKATARGQLGESAAWLRRDVVRQVGALDPLHDNTDELIGQLHDVAQPHDVLVTVQLSQHVHLPHDGLHALARRQRVAPAACRRRAAPRRSDHLHRQSRRRRLRGARAWLGFDDDTVCTLTQRRPELEQWRSAPFELAAHRGRRHVRRWPPLARVQQLARRLVQRRPRRRAAAARAGGHKAWLEDARQRARLEPVAVELAALDDAEAPTVHQLVHRVRERRRQRLAEETREHPEDRGRRCVALAGDDGVEGAEVRTTADDALAIALSQSDSCPRVPRLCRRCPAEQRRRRVDQRVRVEAAARPKRCRGELAQQPTVVEVIRAHDQQRRVAFEGGARRHHRVCQVAPYRSHGRAERQVHKVNLHLGETIRCDALGHVRGVVAERDHRVQNARLLQASQKMDHQRTHVHAQHALAVARGHHRRCVHECALHSDWLERLYFFAAHALAGADVCGAAPSRGSGA